MWKIVKSDILYSKAHLSVHIAILSVIYIVFPVKGADVPHKSFPAVKSVMTASVFFLLLNNALKIAKEKKVRFTASLPVSRLTQAISRPIYIILYWTFNIAALWLGILILRPDIFTTDFVLQSITLSGFVFIVNASSLAHSDLNHIFTGKHTRVYTTLSYTLMLGFSYIFYFLFIVTIKNNKFFVPLKPLKANFETLVSTPAGALTFFIIGVALTILSVFTFLKRKSYRD